jgi:hypothetical protein
MIFIEFLQSVDAGGYGNFYLNAEVRNKKVIMDSFILI